jgi:hypothetical protein
MRGGSEPGERRGGRQKGTKNKATLQREQKLAESGLLPLDFLLRVMRNPRRPLHERLDAAAKAAPYVHPRLKAVEAKITVEKACAQIGQTRSYSPSSITLGALMEVLRRQHATKLIVHAPSVGLRSSPKGRCCKAPAARRIG